MFMVSFYKCEYTEEFAPLMQVDMAELADSVEKDRRHPANHFRRRVG